MLDATSDQVLLPLFVEKLKRMSHSNTLQLHSFEPLNPTSTNAKALNRLAGFVSFGDWLVGNQNYRY